MKGIIRPEPFQKVIGRTAFGIALLSFWAGSAFCQPLPGIQLTPLFPKLALTNLDGMVEAPDGSGRFFIVAQDGQIAIVHRGSDGADSREFLNILDRKPHQKVEDGLLGLAFHPGFQTNSLFYIYYSQHDPLRSVISRFKVSASDPNRADMLSESNVL